MQNDTAIFVISNSPRSRSAAIQIQAVVRGHLCRKHFHHNVLSEALEELAETEEWERDELLEWERQERNALEERMTQATKSKPFPSAAQENTSSPQPSKLISGGPALSKAPEGLQLRVEAFCTGLDQRLRADFQVDALKEFLPPSWRRRWWDLAEDKDTVDDQLDAIQDCILFMSDKLKDFVGSLLMLDPLAAASPVKTKCNTFLTVEDRLRTSAAAIEQHLGELFGKPGRAGVAAAHQQQLREFEKHLQC